MSEQEAHQTGSITDSESEKENELIDRLSKKLNTNEKAFWVCPLVEESEELDLQAATHRYKILQKRFKNKVLLIHGRLKEYEKEEINTKKSSSAAMNKRTINTFKK